MQIGHDFCEKWGEKDLVKECFLVNSGQAYNRCCYIGANIWRKRETCGRGWGGIWLQTMRATGPASSKLEPAVLEASDLLSR